MYATHFHYCLGASLTTPSSTAFAIISSIASLALSAKMILEASSVLRTAESSS